MIRRPPRSPLFPSTTLFRSSSAPKPRPFTLSSMPAMPDRIRIGVFTFATRSVRSRSEEHTSELQSRQYLVCRLLLEKKKDKHTPDNRLYRSFLPLFDLQRTS